MGFVFMSVLKTSEVFLHLRSFTMLRCSRDLKMIGLNLQTVIKAKNIYLEHLRLLRSFFTVKHLIFFKKVPNY